MLFDLYQLQEFCRVQLGPNGVPVPKRVAAIFAAEESAKGVGHGDARERLDAAVRAGDADSARNASLQLATTLVIDTDTIEIAALESSRAALRSSDTWKLLARSYNACAGELAEALRHADPGANPGSLMLAPAKRREAYASFPDILRRLESLAVALQEYLRILEGLNPSGDQSWHGGMLSVLVRDERPLRRQLLEVWKGQPGDRRGMGGRLLDVARAGGTLEASETPGYAPWDVPAMIGDTDPLTASDAEVAATIAANTPRRTGWV